MYITTAKLIVIKDKYMVVRFDTPVTTFVSVFADSLSTLVSISLFDSRSVTLTYLFLSLYEALTDCNGSFFHHCLVD